MSSTAYRADTRASSVVNQEDGCYRESNLNPPPKKQAAAAEDPSLTTHHNQAQDTKNADVAASAAAAVGVRRSKRRRKGKERHPKNDSKRNRATNEHPGPAASSNANAAGTGSVENDVSIICVLICGDLFNASTHVESANAIAILLFSFINLLSVIIRKIIHQLKNHGQLH